MTTSRTKTAAPASTVRRHRDKVPAWYDPTDPASVARYRDLLATRAEARDAGVPIQWWQPYRRYVKFVETHGRFPVRREAEGKWAQDQRAARRAGKLSDEQIALLDAIGFEWDPQPGTRPDEDTWMSRYTALKAFREKHGRYPTAIENRVLYDWRRRQTGQARGYLTEERQNLLDTLPAA